MTRKQALVFEQRLKKAVKDNDNAAIDAVTQEIFDNVDKNVKKILAEHEAYMSRKLRKKERA